MMLESKKERCLPSFYLFIQMSAFSDNSKGIKVSKNYSTWHQPRESFMHLESIKSGRDDQYFHMV